MRIRRKLFMCGWPLHPLVIVRVSQFLCHYHPATPVPPLLAFHSPCSCSSFTACRPQALKAAMSNPLFAQFLVQVRRRTLRRAVEGMGERSLLKSQLSGERGGGRTRLTSTAAARDSERRLQCQERTSGGLLCCGPQLVVDHATFSHGMNRSSLRAVFSHRAPSLVGSRKAY